VGQSNRHNGSAQCVPLPVEPGPSWNLGQPGVPFVAVAPGNCYFASVGSSLEFSAVQTGGPPNGVFMYNGVANGTVTIASINDGTSNTLAFGEWKLGDGDPNRVTPATDVAFSGAYPSGVSRNTPTTSMPSGSSGVPSWLTGACTTALSAPANNTQVGSTVGESWAYGVFGNSMGNVVIGPNAKTPNCSVVSAGGALQNPALFTPGSYHSGGANFLMCDGSVRFIKDSVSLQTLWALGSRGQGEVISADSY